MNPSLIKRYRESLLAARLVETSNVSEGNLANSRWSMETAAFFAAKLPYYACFASLPRLLHSCGKTIVQRLNPVRSPRVIPS